MTILLMPQNVGRFETLTLRDPRPSDFRQEIGTMGNHRVGLFL